MAVSAIVRWLSLPAAERACATLDRLSPCIAWASTGGAGDSATWPPPAPPPAPDPATRPPLAPPAPGPAGPDEPDPPPPPPPPPPLPPPPPPSDPPSPEPDPLCWLIARSGV